MSQQSLPRRTALVLALLLFLCGALSETFFVSANARPLPPVTEKVQDKCATTTDAEIVADIQARIKADKRFKNLGKRINVSSSNHVVTLRGRVRSSGQRNAVIKLARATNCVKRVINKLYQLFADCDPLQKTCPGGVCVAKGAPCPQH